MPTKKLAVVIGRFAPVHKYHISDLMTRAAKYDKVIILLGSAFKALNQKNPFMPGSREMLIRAGLDDAGIDGSKFLFVPLKDYPYSDNRWVLQVQKIIEQTLDTLVKEQRVHKPFLWEPILVGNNKDETSFYLKLFPQWNTDINIPSYQCNATDIRAAIFEDKLESVKDQLSPQVFEHIKLWMSLPDFTRLQREYWAEKKSRTVLAFKDQEGNLKEAPYKPIAYCTDNIVTWRGHVLLIRRRSEPGKGLWALPGGHLNPNEWVKEGAIRELQEETHIFFYSKNDQKRKLFLSADWCKTSHQFDYPGRSQNGRKITTAYHWVIPDEFEVVVEADDDADRAQWFSFYDVLEKMDYDLFEDHQSIIAHMILGPSL